MFQEAGEMKGRNGRSSQEGLDLTLRENLRVPPLPDEARGPCFPGSHPSFSFTHVSVFPSSGQAFRWMFHEGLLWLNLGAGQIINPTL